MRLVTATSKIRNRSNGVVGVVLVVRGGGSSARLSHPVADVEIESAEDFAALLCKGVAALDGIQVAL